VAPTADLRSRLERRPNLDYVSLDLCAPEAMVRADVTRLPFGKNQFDTVLCCHVLEHVPEDREAMREILRVLRPGGWAVLQSPVDYRLEETSEDPALGPEERTRRYGQPDHVRMYGPDYPRRLEEEGFLVESVPPGAWLGPAALRRYGLMEEEEVYLCHAPPGA
jgi:SAM-dependent methyltransferase